MIQKELLRLYYKLQKCLFFNHLPHIDIKHPCLLCQDKTTKRLCQPCKETFLLPPAYRCSCCGLPLSHNALLCGECLRYPPEFTSTFSPYIYQLPLSKLIISFKQKHDLFMNKALSELMVEEVKHYYRHQHLPMPELIVPVPQHVKRQWRRGFNPAIVLANALGQSLAVPIFKGVKRVSAAPEQKTLDRRSRLKNLRNSFKVTLPLQGEHVVIVDDVMTTGATANTLAKALKAAGAGQVSVWVLARTPKS